MALYKFRIIIIIIIVGLHNWNL